MGVVRPGDGSGKSACVIVYVGMCVCVVVE
jgi:hypothetical protein